MYGGLGDAEPLGRLAHRRLVLYHVKRDLTGTLLDVLLQKTTLPALDFRWPIYMRRGAGICGAPALRRQKKTPGVPPVGTPEPVDKPSWPKNPEGKIV